jgi:hypothetical protein
MTETVNMCRSFIGKPLGKPSLQKPRRSLEDNIKLDFKEMDCEDGRYMNFVLWWALVPAVLNLPVILSESLLKLIPTPVVSLLRSVCLKPLLPLDRSLYLRAVLVTKTNIFLLRQM